MPAAWRIDVLMEEHADHVHLTIDPNRMRMGQVTDLSHIG
jgi:hypothetical protein